MMDPPAPIRESAAEVTGMWAWVMRAFVVGWLMGAVAGLQPWVWPRDVHGLLDPGADPVRALVWTRLAWFDVCSQRGP